MSLHFTRAYCLSCFLLFWLSAATAGCEESKSDSKYFVIDQHRLYHNDGNTVLNISGAALQPVFARDVGCGEDTHRIDSEFKIYLQKSENRSAPKDRWFLINPLQTVVWSWEQNQIELTLTEDFIEKTLVRGSFSMKIVTPHGDECIKDDAFTVIARETQGTETETATDTDTCMPGASCDTGSSTEDSTSQLIDTDTYETGQPNSYIDTCTSTALPVDRTTIAWFTNSGDVKIDGKLYDWPTSDGSMLPNQLRRVIYEEVEFEGEVVDKNLCSFDVMWGDALYIAVRCDDDNQIDPASQTTTSQSLIQGDSVEIYIDASNLSPDNSQYSFTILRVGYENSGASFYTPYWVSSPQLEANIAMVSSGRDADGFTMEIKIPWRSLSVDMPTADMTMGFDVAVNDWDSGALRDFQLMWSGSTSNHFNNTNFGQLTFSRQPPPDFLFSQTGDAGSNGCEEPRLVTWENTKTAENPIKVVNWNFSQTANINSCATGDADSWFTVTMPAHSTVYFDVLNNRDFDVEITKSYTTNCEAQNCGMILPQNRGRSIQNNEPDTANATVVVSNKAMVTDDISYITFRAEKNSSN